MYIDLVAVGNNAKSNPLIVKITWDGQWHKEPDEMKKHLVMTEVRTHAVPAKGKRAEPCTAANSAIALWLQAWPLVGRVAELGSLFLGNHVFVMESKF